MTVSCLLSYKCRHSCAHKMQQRDTSDAVYAISGCLSTPSCCSADCIVWWTVHLKACSICLLLCILAALYAVQLHVHSGVLDSLCNSTFDGLRDPFMHSLAHMTDMLQYLSLALNPCRFVYSLERSTAFYKPLVDSLRGPIMSRNAAVPAAFHACCACCACCAGSSTVWSA